MHDLPSCVGPPHALEHGVFSVRPEFGGARPELDGGVVSRKQSARALPAANSARPSSDRTGSACPRISTLPAIAHAPPSWQPGCAPCPQVSSGRSNARRETGNACFRVPANSGSDGRTSGDIPLVALRGPHDTARHHFGRVRALQRALYFGIGGKGTTTSSHIRRCSQMKRLSPARRP